MHSTIEKEIKKALRSGPIYVPAQYVTAIRNSKKRGKPFTVNEMCHVDFVDIKYLACTKLTKSAEGATIKFTDINVIRIEKDDLNTIKLLYKTFDFDDYKEIALHRHFTRLSSKQHLTPLYTSKVGISEKKKDALKRLMQANLISRYYFPFYENL